MLADILGHNLLHLVHSLHIVVLGSNIAKFLDITLSLVVLVIAHHSNANLLMERRQGVLVLVENFLVKFLTLTQTSILNLYVLGSTKQNHTLGKVGNANRLTHIKYEYLATLALSASLENQLTCLRNKHEETYNFRMSYGKRSTCCKLLAEQRNDRTVRTKHVTKTCCNKLGNTLNLAILNSLVETLHVNLANTLRASHNIGWVDSLIGRNHHKLLNAILNAKVGNDLCTVYIVLNTLAWIVLHHRHVLVGSGMEHIIGTECREYLLHTVELANACYNSLGWYVGELAHHHQADIVLRSLGLVDKHHIRRLIHSNLTYHLGTNTTS